MSNVGVMKQEQSIYCIRKLTTHGIEIRDIGPGFVEVLDVWTTLSGREKRYSDSAWTKIQLELETINSFLGF